MSQDQLRRLRALLLEERILSLAVLVERRPHVGLLPYAVTADFDAAIVHASALARHTRGLVAGEPVGLVIHRPDRADVDPLQLARVSIDAVVEALEKGTDAYAAAMRTYVARFPSSEATFTMPDFNLYRLRFEGGRWVGGFGDALRLNASSFQRLAGLAAEGPAT
jgi:putative heme iron utilization protein